MKPPRSILDPSFRYVDAAHTDLRKTFAKARKEQQAAQAQPRLTTVVVLRKRGKG